MARPRPQRRHPLLDERRLEEMALRYVGKYATSRAKLIFYLARKVSERGWEGASDPRLEELADRFCELGYIDDSAYALAKSRSLSSRGYGKRRLEEKLRMSGIGVEDGVAAREHSEREAVDSALRYAERRRIGPFGQAAADANRREKALAAMIRAGHSF
ncbi:MAG TPA: RecX family transcriptional regulator, partial [Sphingomicrobium sp.]|nr:RecX family transcriptional regulator [Sphingomicrobium sp.]